MQIRGWAADPLLPGAKAQVQLFVAGPGGTVVVSNLSTGVYRPDVCKAFPWTGAYQGFSVTVATAGVGTNTVTLEIKDTHARYSNQILASRPVAISGNLPSSVSTPRWGRTVNWEPISQTARIREYRSVPC